MQKSWELSLISIQNPLRVKRFIKVEPPYISTDTKEEQSFCISDVSEIWNYELHQVWQVLGSRK